VCAAAGRADGGGARGRQGRGARQAEPSGGGEWAVL